VTLRELASLNRFFYKYRLRFVWGIVFVLISNWFGVLPPQIIRYAVDLIEQAIETYKIFQGSELQNSFYRLFTNFLLFFAFLVVFLSLLKGVFMYFMRQTIIVMSRWVEYDLKNELYEKYQQFPLGFFRRHNTGDLMARISEDVGKVRMYIGPAVMYGINLLALFIFVIGVMVKVNLELTLYVLLPLPFLAIGIYKVNQLILSRSSAIQKQLGRLTSFSQEAYSGIRVIKSYGLEKSFSDAFQTELTQFRGKALDLVKVDALYFPITMLLIGLSTILTVFIGGIQVDEGQITAGNIAEFVIYVNMLTWPVTSVGWVASIMQQAAASQQRINEILNEKPEINPIVGDKPKLDGDIVFKDVSFTYKQSGILALKDIDFHLKKGNTLGIVGRTGSGKSTLANLISRMYEADTGEILINNNPITSLHPGYLRSKMGYIPQEVFLFSDTISRNISFGVEEPGIEEIHAAAAKAALYETVTQFPDKFDTLVGERGVTLSGGQKQRLAIARALIKKPIIYIIDDCLSALDTHTERDILENIKELTQDSTTIIIGHRISSVMHADEIIVLEHGKIAARGTHEQLIQQKGYYQEIYLKQQQQESQTASL
jgi:ATP-binding cassette subfamily B protein